MSRMDLIAKQQVKWNDSYGDRRAVTHGPSSRGSMAESGRILKNTIARGIYRGDGRSTMPRFMRERMEVALGQQGMSRGPLLHGPRSSSRDRQYGACPMDDDRELLEGMRRVLIYLPCFEEAGFVFGRWVEPKSEPGVVKFSVFSMSDSASAWHRAVYESGLIILGFDWPSWQNEAKSYVDDASRLDTAGLDTLRKLLVTHLRKERFCEGHLESMYECGHLTALMRQLKQIADQMEGNT